MKLLERDDYFGKHKMIDFNTIDVSYSRVDNFAQSMNEEYQLIIHLGVASNSKISRIETRAYNQVEGVDINNEKKDNEKICTKGASLLFTNYPELLIDKIRKTHTNYVTVSKDPGRYLCNYLYYKSLLLQNSKQAILFFHVADFQNQHLAPGPKQQANIIKDIVDVFTKDHTQIDVSS